MTPHNAKASVEVTGGWNRRVMVPSDDTASLFGEAHAVAEQLGFPLEATSVDGASDGHFAAALGLPVLDGLGAVGDGAHARTEWISTDGTLERTFLATGLLAGLFD